MQYSLMEYILGLLYPKLAAATSINHTNILHEEYYLLQQYIALWGKDNACLSMHKQLLLDYFVSPLYFQAGMYAKLMIYPFRNVKEWFVSIDFTQLHLDRLIQLHDQLFSLYTVYSQVISDLFTAILTVPTIGKMQQSCQLTVFSCGLSVVCRDIIVLFLADNCHFLKLFFQPFQVVTAENNGVEYENLSKETLQILFSCLPKSEELLVEFRQAISQFIIYPSLKRLITETIFEISPSTEECGRSLLKLCTESSKSVQYVTENFLQKYERLLSITLTIPNEVQDSMEILSKLLYKVIKELSKEEKVVCGKWLSASLLAVLKNSYMEDFKNIFDRFKKIFQVIYHHHILI